MEARIEKLDCVTPKNRMNGGELRRRMSPRLHQNPNIAPPIIILPDLRVAPSKTPTPDNVSQHSDFHRRMSPRLHREINVTPSSLARDDVRWGLSVSLESSSDVSVNLVSEIERRFGPRPHRDISVTPASSNRDGGRGGLSVSSGTSPDVCVNSATEIERRFSPRLHRDINIKPVSSAHGDCHANSNATPGTSLDAGVNLVSEIERRFSPRLHRDVNITPTSLTHGDGHRNLNAPPGTSLDVGVNSATEIERRFSPGLHSDINIKPSSSAHGDCPGNTKATPGTSLDAGVNLVSEIERRFSPRLNRDVNITPTSLTRGDGRGGLNVSLGMSPDKYVNSASEIERRFSPRLHRDTDITTSLTRDDGCGGLNVSLGMSPDICVKSTSEIERRFSPRLHRDINNTPIILSSDDESRGLSVTPGTSLDVCVNLADEIERRFSPRLHPNTISKHQEDASKDSVFQRRLSPRFHPHQSKEKLNPPLKSCTVGKRLHDDFHPRSVNAAKRVKLHHPESTHLHSIGTLAVSNTMPPHQPISGLQMTNIAAHKNGAVLDTAGRNFHARVKETLRIYNTHYIKLVQEEEEMRKQRGYEEGKDETSKYKERGNHNTMKNWNKGQKVLNSHFEEKRGTRNKMRTLFQADFQALSRMIKRREILNHEAIIGPVPGIDVGYQFYSRAEMVAVGLHYRLSDEIVYVGEDRSEKRKFKQYTLPIALSVVMSRQYEDDRDNSEDIIYISQDGDGVLDRKLQSKDKKLIKGDLAMKNAMDQSVPVRVIRGHDNPDSYSGKIYSYKGLYKVVEILSNKGGMCKYLLKRLPEQPKLSTEQVGFVRGLPPKTSSEVPGLICRDLTNGLEDICIPVTNIHDDPPVGPAGFTYIKTIEVRESVKLPPDGSGCTCKGRCTNASTCACAKLNGSDFPYVRKDGGRLTEPKDIVFECGPNCGCGPECLNRTSQRGIKYHLEVYRTPNKGWAVRSRDFIPSGAPVCEYIGVLSRSDELDNIAENDFIFEIDCLHTMNEVEGRERRLGNLPVSATNVLPKIDEKTLDSTPEFSIDAGSRGNVARFINHSCEPNLFVQCILSAHHDFRLARIVLFASADIPPMQELTYDYGYALDSVVGPDGKVQSLPCFCGTAQCRKRLY